MDNIIVFDHSASGHRASYVSLTCKLLGGKPLIGSFYRNCFKLINAEHLIFTTADGRMLDFFLASVVRAMLGKKTAGIAIRPEICLDTDRTKIKIKAALFKILKRMKKVKTLSILPFSIESRLEDLVDDWILDPQYWDLDKNCNNSGFPPIEPKELVKVAASKGDRLIIASIGKQVKSKGSDYLCNLLVSNPKLSQKYIFVLAGKCEGIDGSLLKKFVYSGGVLIDRYLSDEEIESTYHLIDLVWCCYIPEYNQSSGIFGRAIQNNKNTIVRSGSYLEKIQSSLYSNGIALSLNNVAYDADILARYNNHDVVISSDTLEIEGQEQRFVKLLKYFFKPRVSNKKINKCS
ncbi:MAG: hypothetical protein JKY26_04325 [Pseudomonas sp.]|nr:hypothetical protein [Pseudomonas sp.]